MLRKLIVGCLLVFANGQAMCQSYERIDSLSLIYYVHADWKSLVDLGKDADICAFRSNILLQRFAYAALQLEAYYLAAQYAQCALGLSATDVFTREILFKARIGSFDIRPAIYLGQSLGYYTKGLKIKEVGIETGVKISSLKEPGDFLHGGLKLGIRWGKRFFLDQFFSFNQQQYFWEDYRQLNYTFLPEVMLSHRFSLVFPVQYASYSSQLSHTDSTDFPALYTYLGHVRHQALHLSGMLRFRQGHLQVQAGGSYFSGITQPSFDLAEELGGTIGFQQRYESSTTFKQYQVNASAQWGFNLLKRHFLAGIHTAYLLADKDTGINVRPFLSVQVFKTLGVYMEYGHKGNYMVSSPDAGVLINNVNTRSTKWLAMLSYHLNRSMRLDGTWFFEKGKDSLYQKDFKYQGIFLTFTLYIQS